jgi:hypothetical protein
MRTPHSYNQHRAFCTALRTMRSALVALALVSLPLLINFLQRGVFTLEEFYSLVRAFAVAALIVLFNFIQRWHEKELTPRRRRRVRDDEGQKVKKLPDGLH